MSQQIDEQKAIERSAETLALMEERVANEKKTNKFLKYVLSFLVVAFLLLGGGMVWAVIHAQDVANNACLEALRTIGEMEVTSETATTTTQMVEGDSAVFNNVQGEQYNDAAQKVGE